MYVKGIASFKSHMWVCNLNCALSIIVKSHEKIRVKLKTNITSGYLGEANTNTLNLDTSKIKGTKIFP